MQDLSLHILDIVENSISAGATKVEIDINENSIKDILTIRIKDNGKGMDKRILKKALDPFYTTRKTRRVGLGLSMFAQAAKESEGNFDIKSKVGIGTTVTATFLYTHIDRKPLGNIVDTIVTLIATNGMNVDFIYRHRKNGGTYVFNTRHLKEELEGIAINHPEVLNLLRKEVEEGLGGIEKNRRKK